jgi:hypothetical protein
MENFSKYLNISLSNIPHALITEENKQKFLALGQKLPALFARYLFGYERLLVDKGNTDISISALNNIPPNNFNSMFDFPAAAEYAVNDARWQRLKEFASVWSDKGSLLNGMLEMTALEFDYSSLDDNIIIPSVFMGIESKPDQKKIDYSSQLFKRSTVFITGIEILSGKKIDGRLKELLTGITEKLKPGSHIFQAGLMLARNESPLRICIRKFNHLEIADVFDELFPGSNLSGELRTIAGSYGKFFDRLVLALDINSSGVIKAGIECYFNNKRQPPKEERWEQVLNILCSDGLCDRPIAQELLIMPGKFFGGFNSGADNPWYYAQGLHHIKFSIGTGNGSAAKIYLWSGFNWE